MVKLESVKKNADYYLELAINIIYPRRCPVCDDIATPFGNKIHKECEGKIKNITGSTCYKCGKPLGKQEADKEYCSDCLRVKHEFDKGYPAIMYRSISGSIYRFKYEGREEYADFYAELIDRNVGDKLRKLNADALIPVPMYKSKEKRRGYNQATVLAKALEKRLNIPVQADLIKRTKNTIPMKELDEKARRNNLKKAFKVCSNDVKLKSIIIIDDIYTTGSTIDTIAHEFRKAGVKNIYFCTLAIGQTI